ncbi:MAG TPA: hypothetical protein VKB62_08550 [Streptosporangiaceae bacterium]|nr:hypothetical protein [Streptosporangiaceae bacterium]
MTFTRSRASGRSYPDLPIRAARPELAAELMTYCRDRLTHFKSPRTIDFVPDLPRSPTGKLYKRFLRDTYWAGHQTSIV